MEVRSAVNSFGAGSTDVIGPEVAMGYTTYVLKDSVRISQPKLLQFRARNLPHDSLRGMT
jgi:hypothetical protein